ncbi:flagellar protein FlaG [Chromatium okenii]|uniref:flagellar protein FlaG n=1 Tax=Chromatium okenii TaxID=61644 RepID=UPI001F5B03ED
MTSEQLTATLERINDRLQDNDSTVSFAVDDESGRMVIRVTDTRTDELIRQIPSEEALYFAKYIDEHLDNLVGLVLHQKA